MKQTGASRQKARFSRGASPISAWRASRKQTGVERPCLSQAMKRKPTKRQIQKLKMESMLAQRKSRQVDTCGLCLVRVIGPALRAQENRLGRFMPCGCERLCWSCAYNFAMRESLYCADNKPILNQDDLDHKQVRCPCCNTVASAFQECGPKGIIVEQAPLPFRDLSWEQRRTLRREPPSAWGRPRASPQL